MKKDLTKKTKSNYELLTNSKRMQGLKALGKLAIKRDAVRLEMEESAEKVKQIKSPTSLNETISTKLESELKPTNWENIQPVFPSMYSWPDENIDSLAKQFTAFKKKRKYF